MRTHTHTTTTSTTPTHRHLLVDELAVHGFGGVRLPVLRVVRGAKDDLQHTGGVHDSGGMGGCKAAQRLEGGPRIRKACRGQVQTCQAAAPAPRQAAGSAGRRAASPTLRAAT